MKMVTSGLARAEVTWAAPVSWNCIQYFAALMKENWSIFSYYKSSGKITIGRIKHRKITNNSATQKQSQSQNEILPVC